MGQAVYIVMMTLSVFGVFVVTIAICFAAICVLDFCDRLFR